MDADRPYARLVEAQRLRDSTSKDAPSGTETPAEPTVDEAPVSPEDAAKHEVPLGRRTSSVASVTSEILKRKQGEQAAEQGREYGMIYLFRRMGRINRSEWRSYAFGGLFALCVGAVYPAFGIVYGMCSASVALSLTNGRLAGHTISGFSQPNPADVRKAGDRNALWFFIIAILSTIAIAGQNYNFAHAAAVLTGRIRALSFKAMLRQDSKSDAISMARRTS